MAFEDDLLDFLESRLLSYDPAIDLSPNSPAQLQIIQPIIQRFGEDPFSVDIPTFIQDRLLQEFPDLAANNGGMVEDILSKPSQLLLEPFKRQIELVKLGSSLQNADIMAESEANALGANWFTDRDIGDFASGPVRLFYSQPSTVRCGTDKRFFTSDGLAFFPIQNYSITAQQMAFNRQGNFFFLDVTVRAEVEGDQYNVAKGAINGVEEMVGVVKVANLTAFTTGDPKETNTEYANRIEESLTDRSFVTKRGVLARTPALFNSVRALQVVGGGDLGMDRDILTGTGQGFLHLAGKATIFGDWVWLSEVTYRDDGPSNSITPQPGDTVRFHPTSPAPAATVVVEATVVTILSTSPTSCLFLLKAAPYSDGVTHQGAFALLKPGTISISGVPGGIAANVEVADNTVHLGGHTDVFVRPTQDSTIQTTIGNVTDDSPIVAIVDLQVPTAGQNLVTSASSDFVALGVRPGDLLVIDTGSGFAGTYLVLEIVSSTSIRVSAIFALSSTSLRGRIVRNIRLDLVSPKIPKLPFTDSPVSDLQTNVGSNEFRFASINIQDFGAAIGDTINILEGPDAGEFTIIGFGPVSGSVLVDRVASATGANLIYQIYTKQDGLERPIVRLKGIEVLDSTGQTTGITIPYGDAVDIRPDCNFEGAGNGLITYDKQIVIFPDMSEWASGGLGSNPIDTGEIGINTDARYSLGLAPFDGVIRQISSSVGNQIILTEINTPPFLWNGKRDKILALVSRTDPNFPTSIPGAHKSSDLADAKIGDSITINDGPNQGKYIILDLRVLDLWGKTDTGHRKVALIQVDPPFKVDPIRTALQVINQVNGSPFFSSEDLFGFLQYAADWDNDSSFYAATFIPKLRTSLASVGVTFSSDADLKAFFDPLIRSGYTVGPSAQGTFRTYFLEPVSAELNFGEDPTTFDLASDGSKRFRISPDLDPAQILPESVLPTQPALWNRNLGVRLVQDNFAFLTSGTSFASRGVRVGDVIEFRPAINDLPARGAMTSSWMCVTQVGSNVVQLIIPQSNGTSEAGYGGADNFMNFSAGQLLFIDSGPDLGSYIITKVITQDWVSNPPVLILQLDQSLTHSTDTFPVLSTGTTPPTQADFNSNLPAFLLSTPTLPVVFASTNHLRVDVSTDGGTTWTTVDHAFSSGSYADISSLVASFTGDTAFLAVATPVVSGSSFGLVSVASGPRVRIRVGTSVTPPSAHTALGFTSGVTAAGARGAGTLSGTKRIYGSGLSQFLVNDWVTLYAANNATILANGDDSDIIGTYQVTAAGSDQAAAPFWSGVATYIELDRTDNFPAGDPVYVRWLRHEAPDTTPSNTSNGGKNISDQFVRFRTYDSVSRKITVASIPWDTATTHPLLDTSDQQIQLASPIINTSGGQRDYAHKAPFRVLRPDVFRISSTEMSNNRSGALYFVDVPVIGYGPGEEMNVTPDDGFVLSGNCKIDGYTVEVTNDIFTYSTEEELHLVLPSSVLPVGAAAGIDNQFNLAGQNLQITYDNAPLVEDLQTLYNAPLDRVTASSMLARHFLPGYVIFDAVYSGGAGESDVATEIIKYINNIDPDTAEIRTDLLQDVIKRKGAGTADLPLTVIVLFHGIDRRIRGMRSTKSIGIGDTPFFKGNFKQTYFIAGPDTSGQTTRPVGEQVFLKRT